MYTVTVVTFSFFKKRDSNVTTARGNLFPRAFRFLYVLREILPGTSDAESFYFSCSNLLVRVIIRFHLFRLRHLLVPQPPRLPSPRLLRFRRTSLVSLRSRRIRSTPLPMFPSSTRRVG